MSLFRSMTLVSISLVLVLQGCARVPPPTVERRSRVVAHDLTLKTLPPGSRVVLRPAPGSREAQRLLAHVEGGGDRAITFPVDVDEEVRSGTPSAAKPRPYDVTLEISAPGHLPRLVRVNVPAASAIDAHLARPNVVHVPGEGRALDAARVALLGGRCTEGSALAAKTTGVAKTALAPLVASCPQRLARRFGSAEGADYDWKALGVPDQVVTSHVRSAGLLDASLAAKDDATGRRALALLDRLAREERLNEAARIAELLAAPLSHKRAALMLTLPQSALAARRLNVAAAKLANNDSLGAFHAAADAMALAPWIAQKTYAEVRAARVKALETEARAREADAPLVARAYWLSVAALSSGSADARAGLERTTGALLERLRARVLVSAADPESKTTLDQSLARVLPRHVTVVTDESQPLDGLLAFGISETQRTLQARIDQRSKNVLAFEFMSANPAWEEAQRELVAAEEALGPAREAHQRLREYAADMKARASAGGFAGKFAATAAIAEEVAALAILRSAEGRVRNARAALGRTPRLLKQVERRDVTFPVAVFSGQAKRVIRIRLEGFGAPLEESRDAVAAITREQVLPAPDIEVQGTPSPQPELAALAPATGPTAAELVKRAIDHMRAAEARVAEQSLVAARTDKDVRRMATAAAAYHELALDDATRTAIARQLAEELP